MWYHFLKLDCHNAKNVFNVLNYTVVRKYYRGPMLYDNTKCKNELIAISCDDMSTLDKIKFKTFVWECFIDHQLNEILSLSYRLLAMCSKMLLSCTLIIQQMNISLFMHFRKSLMTIQVFDCPLFPGWILSINWTLSTKLKCSHH